MGAYHDCTSVEKLPAILSSFIIHSFIGVPCNLWALLQVINYDFKEVKKDKDLHVVCFSFEWTRTTPAMEQDGEDKLQNGNTTPS
jgi:hypothetical protein